MAEYTCTIPVKEYRELIEDHVHLEIALMEHNQMESRLDDARMELQEALMELEAAQKDLAAAQQDLDNAKESSAYWYREHGKLKDRLDKATTSPEAPT